MADLPTRELIINKADELFYQRGFEHTSFAHIAEAVGISRGNFYHHFKTKDEILDAVIARRMEKTRHLLAQWSAKTTLPDERIRLFIHILVMNQLSIEQYGCPAGGLCMELAKLNHGLRPKAVNVFSLFREWLGEQFITLGFTKKADELAMHLLAASQGVALLANSFQDGNFLICEVKRLEDWLSQVIIDKQ